MINNMIRSIAALLLAASLFAPVQAAPKVKALVIQDDFTWLTGRLEGTYSSNKFTSANIDFVYVYIGVKNKKKGITYFSATKVKGFIQGTLESDTRTVEGSVSL